jgi:hypothetical protein
MGYSLSIALPTKQACEALYKWLEANFRPYGTALKGHEGDYAAIQRRPSYRPERKHATGFDYGPIGGGERIYVWEVAYLIKRLSKGKLYYDSEPVPSNASDPSEWDMAFRDEEDPEAEKRLIRHELARLEAIWRAEPPL